MFISLLANYLRANGFCIFDSDGDAYTLIVKTKIQEAADNPYVVVHADDV